jgi:hypothetical protein
LSRIVAPSPSLPPPFKRVTEIVRRAGASRHHCKSQRIISSLQLNFIREYIEKTNKCRTGSLPVLWIHDLISKGDTS